MMISFLRRTDCEEGDVVILNVYLVRFLGRRWIRPRGRSEGSGFSFSYGTRKLLR